MYKVYAIASLDLKYVYVGLTSDLDKRLKRHQAGFEKTTKPYAPFQLVHVEDALDRPSARAREKQLKSRSGKRFLYQIITTNFPDLTQYQH